MLLDCWPTVMMARFVFARILMLVKHMIAVLDDHPVPSQPVAPSRPTVLMSTVASPSPYTVTLALPVAGWLAWSNDDTEARLYDAVSVTMPLVDPTVTSADLVLATLAVVVLHIIATSDSQSLASGAVIPIRLF
jgi:cytochrome b561